MFDVPYKDSKKAGGCIVLSWLLQAPLVLFDDPLDSQASQVVPSVYTPLVKTLALVGLCLLVWMPRSHRACLHSSAST